VGKVNLVQIFGVVASGIVKISMKKYNYIYKTTNLINGKIYIGVHSTNNLKDGYIGLGIKRQSDAFNKKKKSRFYNLAHAVCKYGYYNFKKEILYFLKTPQEAYYFESKIVTEEFIKCRNNYNNKVGGTVAPTSKGIKRTSAFKKDRSDSIKKYMDKLVDFHSKEYVVVDTLQNEVYEIKNLSKFCREKNISCDTIRSIIKGTSNLHKNRWWACKRSNWHGSVILKKCKNSPIKGRLFHKNGAVVNFQSLKEASELTKSDRSDISKVLRGRLAQINGWSTKAWEC